MKVSRLSKACRANTGFQRKVVEDPIKKAPTFEEAKKISNGSSLLNLTAEHYMVTGGLGFVTALMVSALPITGGENTVKTLAMGTTGAAIPVMVLKAREERERKIQGKLRTVVKGVELLIPENLIRQKQDLEANLALLKTQLVQAKDRIGVLWARANEPDLEATVKQKINSEEAGEERKKNDLELEKCRQESALARVLEDIETLRESIYLSSSAVRQALVAGEFPEAASRLSIQQEEIKALKGNL